MSNLQYPAPSQKFEITAYKKPRDYREMLKTHVPFTGSPQKHPQDPKKIILIVDPFSTTPFYYLFDSDVIGYAEELPNIVNAEGESVIQVRIWVNKGSIGVQCTPFVVADIRDVTL